MPFTPVGLAGWIPLGCCTVMTAVVGAGTGLMGSCILPVGGILVLSACLDPVFLVNPDPYVLAWIKDNRSHLVIGRIVAIAAVGKTVARSGQFADMVIDSMGTATARIILGISTRPVVIGSEKAGPCRRIAVTTVAGHSPGRKCRDRICSVVGMTGGTAD